MIQLTDREFQIAELVVKANTNPQIAHALGISALTVKNHMASMFRRTDTQSRVELAVLLQSQGFMAVGRKYLMGRQPRYSSRAGAGNAEYEAWVRSFQLTLTVKKQAPGEEEYISWYFLSGGEPVMVERAVGWIISRRGGDVMHISALDGYSVDAVAFQTEMFHDTR